MERSPTSNNWNTADNWTPATVPDGTSDIATFDISNVTNISLASEVTLDRIVFNNGASTYTIRINENNPAGFILFSGAGVINISGVTQNIVGFSGVGFVGTATAGAEVTYLNQDDGDPSSFLIGFIDHSDAGSATLLTAGVMGAFGRVLLFSKAFPAHPTAPLSMKKETHSAV